MDRIEEGRTKRGVRGGDKLRSLDRGPELGPLALLARMKDRDGEPYLPKEALAAGEQLARDFHKAQLQPRVTASLLPRLETRTRGSAIHGDSLSDSAEAARRRVNQAISAIEPDLGHVALDVCCFEKGLETVERERSWPARSAKLMLRTALLALARHYAPPPRAASMRHWAGEGYRPSLNHALRD